jgi:hypothetical protein
LPAPDQLWTEHDVARYLNVSNWSVRSWRQQGKLGFTHVEGVIRYVPEEVKAFALRGRKAPRCPDCGNNGAFHGDLLLPGECSPGEPLYFSDLEAQLATDGVPDPA